MANRVLEEVNKSLLLWPKEIEARILSADQNGTTYALDEVMTTEEKRNMMR